MKMKRYSPAIAFILSLFITLSPALAQETIVRDVAASGGGKSAGSGYQLLHTVGQPVIDLVTNADNKHEIGFWYLPWFFVTDAGEETPQLIFRLDQNYPNPFNPVTTIQFTLPKPGQVNLKIYDVLGREVMTVIDKKMEVGVHKIPVNANGLSSGVYFYRLIAAHYVKTRKMVLLK
jgi:hypothetical protein